MQAPIDAFFAASEAAQIGTTGYHARHAGVGITPLPQHEAQSLTVANQRSEERITRHTCAEVSCTAHVTAAGRRCRRCAAVLRWTTRQRVPGPKPIVGRVR